MIYPRLRLARELLRDDGVIFVSIDDNEAHHLRVLMNEVFGEENFLGEFVVNSSPSAIDYGHMGKVHDYVLFYARSCDVTLTNPIPDKEKTFKYRDEEGPFNLYPLYNGNVAFNPATRPNLYYPFYVDPNSRSDDGLYEIGLDKKPGWVEVFPVESRKEGIQRVWRWGKPKARRELNKEIAGYETGSGDYRIVQKARHTGKVIRSILDDKAFSSRRGTKDIEDLFGAKIFSFPKAVELVKQFVIAGSSANDIVMDFFAGSGPTGQAVAELNGNTDEQRKFILVQMPEAVQEDTTAYNKGFRTISELCAERVRRALSRSKEASPITANNMGLCLYRLTSSHYRIWQNYHGDSIEELELLFDEHTTPLVDDWKTVEDGLFTEILLLEGFPLDSVVNTMSEHSENNVRRVECSFHENRLLVCLDDQIGQDTIKQLDLTVGDTFICLDSAIDDETKTRLADKGLIKTI